MVSTTPAGTVVLQHYRLENLDWCGVWARRTPIPIGNAQPKAPTVDLGKSLPSPLSPVNLDVNGLFLTVITHLAKTNGSGSSATILTARLAASNVAICITDYVIVKIRAHQERGRQNILLGGILCLCGPLCDSIVFQSHVRIIYAEKKWCALLTKVGLVYFCLITVR